MFFTNKAITITQARGVLVGATKVSGIQIRHVTDRSAAGTALFTGTETVSNTTTGADMTLDGTTAVVADSWVWIETGGISGTPSELAIHISYRPTV